MLQFITAPNVVDQPGFSGAGGVDIFAYTPRHGSQAVIEIVRAPLRLSRRTGWRGKTCGHQARGNARRDDRWRPIPPPFYEGLTFLACRAPLAAMPSRQFDVLRERAQAARVTIAEQLRRDVIAATIEAPER